MILAAALFVSGIGLLMEDIPPVRL